MFAEMRQRVVTDPGLPTCRVGLIAHARQAVWSTDRSMERVKNAPMAPGGPSAFRPKFAWRVVWQNSRMI
jgi:hypothetical protein